MTAGRSTVTTAETTPSTAEPTAEPSQVKDVLERAIADPEFGRQLLDDPDAAWPATTSARYSCCCCAASTRRTWPS